MEQQEETAVDRDPRYQVPLQAGWWKAGAGWQSVLKSHRVDRRAKPVVIAIIVALFLIAVYGTDGVAWGIMALIAGLLIVVVLVFSPLDPAAPVPRQPLESEGWKTKAGWKALPNATDDEPGVGFVGLLAGLLAAGLVLAVAGRKLWFLAVLLVLFAGRGLFRPRYQLVLETVAIAVLFAGIALGSR